MSIDTSEALTIPGVVAVVSTRDLPVPDIRAAVDARRILFALDDVQFAGHPALVSVHCQIDECASPRLAGNRHRLASADTRTRIHRIGS